MTRTPQETLPVQAEHQDTCHGLLAHPFEACQLSLDLLRAQVCQGLSQEVLGRCFCFVRLSRMSAERESSIYALERQCEL